MANITSEKDSFLKHQVGKSFGCSMDAVVNGCYNKGRFLAWLGGNKSQVKSLLQTVEKQGVSKELFAAYEINEGFSAGLGWLNHTGVQGNATQDAIAVCKWLVATSSGHQYGPAWDDPYGGSVGVVPASAQAEGNAHYKSLPDGSIGQVYIAGTAAATWAAYYPQALKASVNHAQNYGDPIQGAIDSIRSWGGKIKGSGSSVGGQSSSSNKSGGGSGGGKSSNGTRTGNFSGGLYLQNSNLWGTSKGKSSKSSDSPNAGNKETKTSNSTDNSVTKVGAAPKEVSGNKFSGLVTSTNVNGMNNGGALKKVSYIVIHHNATTSKNVAMNTWLQSAGNYTSAHYEITDTEIIGCVGENLVAWHCGGRGTITNDNSIGLEHVNSSIGNPNDASSYLISEKTINNGAKLAADICKRHGIKPSRKTIVGHREVSSTACPATINLDKYVEKVKKYYGS